MKIYHFKVVSILMLGLTMNISLVYGRQFKLWGNQKEGTFTAGPQRDGNTVILTVAAKIDSISRNADSFTVYRNGIEFVSVEKGKNLAGILPPGEYKLRTGIGSVNILLDTDFSAENIVLWGRQTALTEPRHEGNYIVLPAVATIVTANYDGVEGMGIFGGIGGGESHRAFLRYTSPHNLQNPGPKVVDINGAVVGKTLIGLILPAGVYSLTPGRRAVDGVVYGEVVLSTGAVAGPLTPLTGWQPVVSGDNRVEINANEICIDAMRHGMGFATQKRTYDFTRDYTVEFDFQLREKNNHWFILYSDTFLHLHLDWGTDLHYLGPSNTRIMNMEVGRWYRVKLAARPAQNSFDIYIDGKHVGAGKNVKPGSLDVGPGLGTSGTDGSIGAWVYVGDFLNTAYNRGSACWKNISISYPPADSGKTAATYSSDSVNEAGAYLTSRDYVQKSGKMAGDGNPDWCFPIRLIGTGTVESISINNISGQYSIWDTLPANHFWLTAVVIDGRVLNRSDGSVSFPISGDVGIELYVADNGSLQGNKTRYKITVRFNDGREVTLEPAKSRLAHLPVR